jgi:hypothetical protein
VEVDRRIVRDWIALSHTEPNTPEYERLFAVFGVVVDMTHDRPEEAWAFVLAVLAADDSTRVMENLAAGPLEDLLVYHGPAVIERVEAEARTNPKFAFLLGGVWKNAIADDIWDRVRAVWDRRGWDGIPVA